MDDGTRRTIVWRRRHGGSRTALEIFAATMSALDGTHVVHTGKISVAPADLAVRHKEPARWIGTVLGPEDEVQVPCGRRHAGKRGSVPISDRRFIEQLKRIAG